MLKKLKNKYFKFISDEDFLLLTKTILNRYHQFKVREIIEKNTDIFSVFHYQEIRLLKEINNISYYVVKEIASEKYAIINSNKEIIIPFDYYFHSVYFDIFDDNIRYFDDTNAIYFDLEGNVQKKSIKKYNKFKSKDIPISVKEREIENKFCEELINLIDEQDIEINFDTLHKLKHAKYLFPIKHIISFL